MYPSSNAPTVTMVGVAPGTTTAVHFNTPANLGLLQFGVGSKKLTGIQGSVIFDGGANGSSISMADSLDTVGRTAHLTQNSLGAIPGDDLFPAGGSLTFTNIKAGGANPGLNLGLGSGGNTIFAQPNATGTISISGAPSTAAGTINLALAAAQNYAINGNAASGNVTSSNLKTLSWVRFAGGPNVDDVAPALAGADINLDGIPAGAAALGGADAVNQQSLDVQFSEDLGQITPASLQLMNLTTQELVPASAITVSYDAATFTAHFTFPGYFNGELPDGNYEGTIVAAQTADAFGNALAADATFDFFFVAGDANHDRKIDLTDFTILAANFNGAGKRFSEGDFNYDGHVDLTDFTILASKFNFTLATGDVAAEAATPLGVVRAAPVDEMSSGTRLVEEVLGLVGGGD
jgi:hypothetical protein